MSGESPVLAAARTYAERGWGVLPLKADKSPLTPHGFHDATADQSAVTDLWARSPEAPGVGIRTGAESGLVVLDIDPDKGGEESLADLEREHGRLPQTVEVATGGGGRHLYFRHPGAPIRNSAGKLGPGLDIRGDGGYVVAPPSLHPSSARYQWLRSPENWNLANVPGWLPQTPKPSPDAESARTPEETIPEGRRNATLTSVAGRMRRIGLGEEEIAAALQVYNAGWCKPPLGEDEVAGIAASVSKYAPEAESDTAASRVLKVQSAKEILEMPDPPSDGLLLGPLVMRSARTVIGAHTGHGKTTFALQMIHAVTTRSTLLDYTGAGGKALVIDAEQGLRTVKRRLREANLAESTQVDYLRVPDGLALDQDGGEDVAQVEAILDAGQYDLVLADPLYKLHRGDSNEERHAVDMMRLLDAWRERFDFGLILLVHRRKAQVGNRSFTMDDLFGSGAYLRGAEVVLGLHRPSPGFAHLHVFKDRDGDLPVGEKWGLLFDREDGFRHDPEADKEKETALDKVRAALEEAPEGLTMKQLEAQTGYADKTIRKSVQDLGAESERGPNGTKVWRLPDEVEAE